ncbi:MAG: hypothetical protein HYT79_03185 [Elusimicrobia bacterium]|nr:hypothetical protein [Elusimicrobiota bacterium]
MENDGIERYRTMTAEKRFDRSVEMVTLVGRLVGDKRWRDLLKRAQECPNCSKALKKKGRNYLETGLEPLAEMVAESSAR